MKIKLVLASSIILALSACASTSPTDSTKVAEKVSARSDMRCTAKAKIGSHISKKRCVSQKQYDQDKKNSQEQVQRIQNGPRVTPKNSEF